MTPGNRKLLKAGYDKDREAREAFPVFDNFVIGTLLAVWREGYFTSRVLQKTFPSCLHYIQERIEEELLENEYFASVEIRAQFPTTRAYIMHKQNSEKTEGGESGG